MILLNFMTELQEIQLLLSAPYVLSCLSVQGVSGSHTDRVRNFARRKIKTVGIFEVFLQVLQLFCFVS